MRLALFFRHGRLTLLVVVLILVAGLASLSSLPRQEDPALSERFGHVMTAFPGADALRVDALVTEKIENALQEVAGIKRISSRTQTGLSIVYVELEGNVYHVESVWSEVRSKLIDVRHHLPRQAEAPNFRVHTTAAITVLVAFRWVLDTEPQLGLVYRLVRALESALVALPGTKETEIYGAPVEEIIVSVDALGLAAGGLSVEELSAIISGADPKIGAGRLQGDHTAMVVEVDGAIDSLERVRRIPIRSGGWGSVLRVSDIARVERAARQPPQTMSLIDGQRGIVLGVKVGENRRVDRWTADVREKVRAFAETLPAGIDVEVIFDQSTHTEERLTSLVGNLLVSALIVMLVLFLMMGWRSALIVSTALPLTLLVVVALFNPLGVPLHQISITGLIIALGLLIDNAIVAVDEYNQALQSGKPPPEAIDYTIRHLFVPLSASTATTVLIFLPLVLMPGIAGEFVGTLGVGVILSVICSLVLSITIVPAIAGFIDTRWPQATRQGSSPSWIWRAHRRVLEQTLRRPAFAVACGVALPVVGFVLSTQLVDQFFPPVNRDQFQIQLKLPTQASIEETRRVVERARAILHSHPEVHRSHWFLGEKPPRVFYNVSISEDGAPRFAGAFVDTISAQATRDLLPRLQMEMIAALPEAMVLTLPFEQGPPLDSPIEVRIYGPDLYTLARLGAEIRLILSRTQAVTFSESTITTDQPKLIVRADEDAARIVGLSLRDIASQLDSSLDGVTGGSVLEGTEELPVRVRFSSEERTSMTHVAVTGMALPDTASGAVAGAMPLNAVARIELVPSIASVTRWNGVRVNTIHAYLRPFSLPAPSLADFKARLDEAAFALPPGYQLEYGGETEGSDEARVNLMDALGLLLVLLLGTLVLAFNSFRMAITIALVALLVVGCGLLSVWVFGYPLGFMAIIGIMGLMGIAINDAIVVLAKIMTNDRARVGEINAIVNVVLAATRHVISTTLTTIGAFFPLIVWGGVFWPPLAVAVAGGMIGATILALYFVPPMYLVIQRIGSNWSAPVDMR